MAKQESGMDRLRKVKLWQWGLIVIFAGIMANLVLGLQPPPSGSAAARGAALGRGIATMLFVLVGIVLVVVGLIRAKR